MKTTRRYFCFVFQNHRLCKRGVEIEFAIVYWLWPSWSMKDKEEKKRISANNCVNNFFLKNTGELVILLLSLINSRFQLMNSDLYSNGKRCSKGKDHDDSSCVWLFRGDSKMNQFYSVACGNAKMQCPRLDVIRNYSSKIFK